MKDLTSSRSLGFRGVAIIATAINQDGLALYLLKEGARSVYNEPGTTAASDFAADFANRF